MSWSSTQYLKFEDERTRPARDLLAQVPLDRLEIGYDLGCGPGNSTELLAARFPGTEIIGIDSDDDMLKAASKRMPDLQFLHADLVNWQPETAADLFFANAVFQWIPDHLSVLGHLLDSLNSGGVLAVQMPDNLNEPTHLLMEEIAKSAAFTGHFGNKSLRRSILPTPQTYFDTLGPKCSRIDVWHTIYYHRLANAEAVVEWVKGTGLRPYLNALPEASRQDYLDDYLAAISSAYHPMADGTVLLKFPRLFLIAVKA